MPRCHTYKIAVSKYSNSMMKVQIKKTGVGGGGVRHCSVKIFKDHNWKLKNWGKGVPRCHTYKVAVS